MITGNLFPLLLRKTRGMLYSKQVFEIHIWKKETSMITTNHYGAHGTMFNHSKHGFVSEIDIIMM